MTLLPPDSLEISDLQPHATTRDRFEPNRPALTCTAIPRRERAALLGENVQDVIEAADGNAEQPFLLVRIPDVGPVDLAMLEVDSHQRHVAAVPTGRPEHLVAP